MRVRNALIGVAAIGVLLVMSGIAGIAVGGTSAQAGWWLVVVGILTTSLAVLSLGGRPAA